MTHYVISPNVKNNNECEVWKRVISATKCAYMGWADDDNNKGKMFSNIEKGDLILVAQGSNVNKAHGKNRLIICGIATSGPEYRQINDMPSEARIIKLEEHVLDNQKLESLGLDFTGCAYGTAKQTPAIYQLKPDENQNDQRVVRTLLNELKKVKKETDMQNTINLLKSKKQIILQGPPGTGKTYTAKDIAAQMILGKIIDDKKAQMKQLDESEQFSLIQFHPAYSYEDFVRGIVAKTENGQVSYEVQDKVLGECAKKAQEKPNQNYLLIIDEINRANLPAVLGELIYALEYRGDSVQTPYALDGDSKITLPPNLYIIGTMNTADRSVGHIDYAIRRRFAFVEMLPDESVIENIENTEGKQLFAKVATLFKKDTNSKESKNAEYLSPEFKWQDVQIGHSYFMVQDTDELKQKLEYEIKPILQEYLKDGVLLEKAKEVIEKLST